MILHTVDECLGHLSEFFWYFEDDSLREKEHFSTRNKGRYSLLPKA